MKTALVIGGFSAIVKGIVGELTAKNFRDTGWDANAEGKSSGAYNVNAVEAGCVKKMFNAVQLQIGHLDLLR